MAEGKKTGGRQAGTPNKATGEARQAIALFVDQNAPRLTEWLDRVADGVKDEEGNYLVPPNPAKAFDMFQSVVEYHVPKLARMEMAGDPNAPIRVEGQFDIFDELLKHYSMSRQQGQ
jgi:hypothetical protein